MRGGGKFVGLPGPPWQSLHVDELRGDPHQLDVQTIRGKKLSEIVESGIIDYDQLIDDAIPKAVSKTSSHRVERRLEILIGNSGFRKSVKSSLLDHLEREQEKMLAPEKWLVKMAVGNEFLQEGNTFAKSIWLHLVSRVAEVLRPIVELWDRNGGLEHAMEEDTWRHKVHNYFVDRQCREIANFGASDAKLPIKCSFPFSWVLVNLMDRLVEQKPSLLDIISGNEYVDAVHEIIADLSEARLSFIKDLILIKCHAIEGHEELINDVTKVILSESRRLMLERGDKQFDFITIVDIYQAVSKFTKR